MRKLGIIVIAVLLVAVVALMMVSTGLLPFSLSGFEQSSSPVVASSRLAITENRETEHHTEVRPRLEAKVPLGRITVRGAEMERITIKKELEVRAASPFRVQELLEQTSLEISTTDEANKLSVSQPTLRQNENITVNLTITVPVQTELDLHTDLGQVDVSGIQADLHAFNGLGTIQLGDFQGNALLETALGNIEITDSKFENELIALTHLGDLVIAASLAETNILESGLGNIQLLVSPQEAYVLEGSINLGRFTTEVPFAGQQDQGSIIGILGEGEQLGSIFADVSLGSLDIKNQNDGRD